MLTQARFSAKELLFILTGPALIVAAYYTYGWGGVALALGTGVMWALLHFTRMLQVLKRAAQRPKGWVGSAVMLNAKLHTNQKMLDVLRLTGALGEPIKALDHTQTEVWRWTDDGQAHVDVVFAQGKVQRWALVRSDAPQPN